MRRLGLALTALAAVLLAGCGTSSPPSAPPPDPSPVVMTTPTPVQTPIPRTTTMTPTRLMASVPSELVGLYLSEDGTEFLSIGEDASYARATVQGQTFDAGWLQVTRDGSWTFLPSGRAPGVGTYGYRAQTGELGISVGGVSRDYSPADTSPSPSSGNSSSSTEYSELDDFEPPCGPYTPGC